MGPMAREGLRKLWLRRNSPEVWLLASNLLSRFLGFFVSLLISRQLGLHALGLYSGVLITATSPTAPLSSAMASNATMMAARQGRAQPLWPLFHAQRWVFAGGLLLSFLGAYAMVSLSGLHGSELASEHVVWVALFGLVAGQLLTQTIVGAHVGADLSLPASQVVSAFTVLAIVLAYPVMSMAGLPGLLLQAMLVALLPGLLLGARARMRAHRAISVDELALKQAESWTLMKQALPSIAATVLNNGTNWLACIYLVEKYHGRLGLGLIAIGLQWMAIMLLPMSSWSGQVMRLLALAHQSGVSDFWREVRTQVRKCLLVSTLAASAVLVCLVPIGMLYKVAVSDILWLFSINAVACALSAISFVYERVFYCLGRQRPWLFFSILAYTSQLLLTFCMIPYSILAVPLGNLFATLMLIMTVTLYLRRLKVVA